MRSNRVPSAASASTRRAISMHSRLSPGADRMSTASARGAASVSPAAAPREASGGRYPLVRSATKDVTLDDFGKLFGPNGVMDDFFATHREALHLRKGV